MFTIQILVVAITLVLFSFLISALFKKFGRERKMVAFFVIPLFVFCLGFIFRMSKNQSIVDLGFFLTDFSGLFISTLFATCILLGQLKYWKK
jgi:cyanate permease